jgi:hypothetical protein
MVNKALELKRVNRCRGLSVEIFMCPLDRICVYLRSLFTRFPR